MAVGGCREVFGDVGGKSDLSDEPDLSDKKPDEPSINPDDRSISPDEPSISPDDRSISPDQLIVRGGAPSHPITPLPHLPIPPGLSAIIEDMKRSEINRAIETAAEFFARMSFRLPEYAFWPPEKWLEAGPEFDEIRECMLGWDVTDFGSGDFKSIGRTLFTLRNGRKPEYPKVYAEKIIFNPEGQRAPLHFHQSKMEDIINRGGGNVVIQVWQAGANNKPSDQPLALSVSGIRRSVKPGDIIRIEPGESICLPPRTFHQFWGEEGTGPSISGEVSSVCDDRTDNYFLEAHERFPAIEEDEPPRRLLCSEYPRSG